MSIYKDFYEEYANKVNRAEELLEQALCWVSEHCPTDEDYERALKHIGMTEDEIEYHFEDEHKGSRYDVYKELRLYIDNMNMLDKIRLWNGYAYTTGQHERIIHYMSEFNDLLKFERPYDIAALIDGSGFCVQDTFFTKDKDEVLSFNNPIADGVIDLEEVIVYMLDTGNDLWDEKVKAILKEEKNNG